MAKIKKQNQLPFGKNDILELNIDDFGAEGEGIARLDGYVFFIKDVVPGDVIQAKVMKTKKNYGYARLIKVIRPSKDRVQPRCPIACSCGGCQIQHVSYTCQLLYKQNKIKNCLMRIGAFSKELLDTIMDPVIGMEEPYYYRNKAQFPVGKDKDGNVVTGFYANRSHSIIPMTDCFIQSEVNKVILKIVLDFMKEFHIEPYDEKNRTGTVRHILTRMGYVTGEVMVCLVLNQKKLPGADKLVSRLKDLKGMKSIVLNVNEQNTNVILGSKVEVLWGQAFIEDYIGDIKYRISPLSFYQVNPVQTKKLYGKALEFAALTGEETVWDLYCGIGTISLFLAQKAKMVYGVEIIPDAVRDANINKDLNGMDNVCFFEGAAENVVPEQYKNDHDSMKADVVILDPPRKGCDKILLETILDMLPDRIVYVSCDPATLARDLKILCEGGYELKKVQGCDMFPHTVHVECVVLMSRVEK